MSSRLQAGRQRVRTPEPAGPACGEATSGRTSLPTMPVASEYVVLLDEQRRPVGRALKAGVHHASTPLHLAFSLYLFDEQGQVLLTQRASTKRTWPGTWSNACCGHPAPEEDLEAAVRRRVGQELGVEVVGLRPVLPHFAYYAVDAGGTVENEYCPVFAGIVQGVPAPLPEEVAALAWLPWPGLLALAASPVSRLSPWSVLQLEQLGLAGFAPSDLLSA